MEEERNDEMPKIEMPKSADMKPCPHCGDADHLEMLMIDDVFGKPFFTVICNYHKGGCGARGGGADSAYRALELWNMRSLLGYQHATWYGVPYDEACRVLRKALIDRDGITCEMIPHPDYDLVTCSNCGHEDDTNIVYVIGGHVEYRGKFCTECGAPVREGGAR